MDSYAERPNFTDDPFNDTRFRIVGVLADLDRDLPGFYGDQLDVGHSVFPQPDAGTFIAEKGKPDASARPCLMGEGRVPGVPVPAAASGRGIPSSEGQKSFELLPIGWAEKGTDGLPGDRHRRGRRRSVGFRRLAQGCVPLPTAIRPVVGLPIGSGDFDPAAHCQGFAILVEPVRECIPDTEQGLMRHAEDRLTVLAVGDEQAPIDEPLQYRTAGGRHMRLKRGLASDFIFLTDFREAEEGSAEIARARVP